MTCNWKWRLILLFCSAVASGCAAKGPVLLTAAQAELSAPTVTTASMDLKQSGSILGIGDTVDIDVYRHSDLKKSIRIEDDGKISFPMVGNIQAAGLSITTFKNKLTDELAKYIIDPQVTVGVKTMHSQKVYVLGEVVKPGIVALETPLTAVEAISQVGGFTTDAKDESVILIRGEKTNPQLVKLNIESVLKEANLGENIQLRGGDVLYVPPTFIADVSRFSVYLANILRPILMLEQGVVLGDEVNAIYQNKDRVQKTTVVIDTTP